MRGQLSISVLIKLRESVSEHLDLIFWNTRGDQSEGRSLKILGFYVIAHILNHIDRYYSLFLLLLPLATNPRVVEGLLRSEAHISLSLKKILYEILCVVANLGPYSGRKVKATVQDVMQNLIIILPSKRWSPAEHDIHYDSHRPVIALSGVAALQDLWRDVVRGTVWSGH